MELNLATKKRKRMPSISSTRADTPATVDVIDDPIGQLLQFPPGIRFCPHDSELIEHYLTRKIHDEGLPSNIVKSVNLYKYHPETLIEKYKGIGETAWYFFTPRSRKYAKGSQTNRSANRGYWKATGADKTIMNNKEEAVGLKKSLSFFEGKQPGGTKTDWKMHEYRILEDNQPLGSWVLCKVYNNDYSKSMPRYVATGESDGDGELTKDNSSQPAMPSDSEAQVAFPVQEQNYNEELNGWSQRLPMAPNRDGIIHGGTTLAVSSLSYHPVLPQGYKERINGVQQYDSHYEPYNYLQRSWESIFGSGSEVVFPQGYRERINGVQQYDSHYGPYNYLQRSQESTFGSGSEVVLPQSYRERINGVQQYDSHYEPYNYFQSSQELIFGSGSEVGFSRQSYMGQQPGGVDD